jgi:hypothetical protein
MREIFRKITDSSANWLQKRIENSIQGQSKDNKNLLSRIALDKLQQRGQPEKQAPPEYEAMFNQWRTVIEQDRYEFSNPDESGEIRRFYSMANGIYGEPLITAEPDRAFDLPSAVGFVNAKGQEIDKPPMKISGIICQSKAEAEADKNSQVKVDHRVSLSNVGDRTIEHTEDGLLINGERWYLKTLFSKDGNRIKNYDAYYVKDKPANYCG